MDGTKKYLKRASAVAALVALTIMLGQAISWADKIYVSKDASGRLSIMKFSDTVGFTTPTQGVTIPDSCFTPDIFWDCASSEFTLNGYDSSAAPAWSGHVDMNGVFSIARQPAAMNCGAGGIPSASNAEIDPAVCTQAVQAVSCSGWTYGNWTPTTPATCTPGTILQRSYTPSPQGCDGSPATAPDSIYLCPASLPGAPTSVVATAGNASATVSFSPPSSNGGSAITLYTVTSSPGGISVSGASSPITVSGLTNGTTYTFSVTATNAMGTGPASTQSNSATPTAGPTVPGVPLSVSASAGNASATVSFSPPSSNGGSAITSYTVTSIPGGITASGASSPITVFGLTNGTTYTFTVAATNSVGTGPASSQSNSVTPTGVSPAGQVPITADLVYNTTVFSETIAAGTTHYFTCTITAGETSSTFAAPELSQNADLDVFIVQGASTLTGSAADTYYSDFVKLYDRFGWLGYAFVVPSASYAQLSPPINISTPLTAPLAWASMGADKSGESIILKQSRATSGNTTTSLPGKYYIAVKNKSAVSCSYRLACARY